MNSSLERRGMLAEARKPRNMRVGDLVYIDFGSDIYVGVARVVAVLRSSMYRVRMDAPMPEDYTDEIHIHDGEFALLKRVH